MNISELPNEIKIIALKRQKQCDNIEYEKPTDKLYDAFDWSLTIEGVDIWENINAGIFDQFYEFYKNNGWIKIENENNLPTIDELYFVNGENCSIHQCVYHEGIKDYWLENFTHYQPIIKPNKPLY